MHSVKGWRGPRRRSTAFSEAGAGERFERPASLADCLALLHAHPEARIVAGATDLGVEANLRGQRWPMLVSVEGVPELKTFSETADAIEIGAGLTLSEVEERWTSAPAAVHDWFALFASPLIRNRATLGGNLATASPVGDSAPLLLALDTVVRAAGPDGVRSIPLCEFFTAYRQTALRPGELIVSLRVPKPLPSHLAFYKAAKRTMDDISTVAAAFAIDLDRTGRIIRARAAYGGVAATPVLLADFAKSLPGRKWNRAAMHHAQQAVARRARAAQRSSRQRRVPAGALTVADRKILVGDAGGARRMSPVGQTLPHESAAGHVTGKALYTDDLLSRFPGPAPRLARAGPARPRRTRDARSRRSVGSTRRGHGPHRGRRARRGRFGSGAPR